MGEIFSYTNENCGNVSMHFSRPRTIEKDGFMQHCVECFRSCYLNRWFYAGKVLPE